MISSSDPGEVEEHNVYLKICIFHMYIYFIFPRINLINYECLPLLPFYSWCGGVVVWPDCGPGYS